MKIKTALIHRGRQSITQKGLGINVPVHRASTIVSPDFTSYLARFDDERIYDQVVYGATGTRNVHACLLYTSPSPRDRTRSRMPSSA